MRNCLVNNLYKTSKTGGRHYKMARNRLVSLIRKEKRRFYERQLEECGTDQSRMWRVFRNLLMVKQPSLRSLRINDEVITDVSQKAAKLNNYFVESIECIVAETNIQLGDVQSGSKVRNRMQNAQPS